MSQPIRLVLADDHRLIRSAVRAALTCCPDIEVAGEATNGDDAVHCCRRLQPDILLLDLRMPGPPAIEIVETLATDAPACRVVILSANDDEGMIAALVRAGIAGYLLKDDAPYELVQAVRAAARGTSFYSVTILRKYQALLEELHPPS